jgi:hypothetical protein
MRDAARPTGRTIGGILWSALKLTLGVGTGLAVGCLIAALLAPAAGEDTRRELRALFSGEGAGAPRPILERIKTRFAQAVEAARRAQSARESQLRDEFATAKRTGSAP